jgi:hypothetical protein
MNDIDYKAEVLKVYPNAVIARDKQNYGYRIFENSDYKNCISFTTKHKIAWMFAYNHIQSLKNHTK